MAGQVLIQEIVRLNAIGAQSSDVLPIAARKEEVTKLFDRLELMMVTVGAKAPIFSELLSPALDWLDMSGTYTWANFRFATWRPT